MRFDKLAGAALLSLAALVTLAACGSDTSEEEGTGEANSALSGSTENDKTAFLFFVGKGLTTAQAAGVVGNLDQESSMNPASVQAGGPGRGIAQWSLGARWSQENAFAKQQGASDTNLNVQLKFIWHELTTNAAFGLSSLEAAKSVSSAVEIFQDKYEICGKCNNASRLTFAQRALTAFGKDAASAQSAPADDDDDDSTQTDPEGNAAGDDDDDDTDLGACEVSGSEGECLSTSSCSGMGGESTPGHCPGAANIQCCTFDN